MNVGRRERKARDLARSPARVMVSTVARNASIQVDVDLAAKKHMKKSGKRVEKRVCGFGGEARVGSGRVTMSRASRSAKSFTLLSLSDDKRKPFVHHVALI